MQQKIFSKLAKKKAVVLLSGGLDSTTVLAVAKSQGYECFALSFDYNQKHNIELTAAKSLAASYKIIEHKIVNIDFLSALGHSALTEHDIAVPEYKNNNNAQDIPVTYVPARNTVFLSIALAWAEVLSAETIFIGASAVDYSGYPDCRPEYFKAFQNLVNIATKLTVTGAPIAIKTPLINLSKAATIKLGVSLGVDYSKTISCYQANSSGRACGKCDSCILRRQGFAAADIADPTKYY